MCVFWVLVRVHNVKHFANIRTLHQLEAEFSLKDPTQHVVATQLSWAPLEVPAEKVTFPYSLKTMMGNQGPLAREGLAVHMYCCNASMDKTAFVNSDGDFLIVPTTGRLDIQTEMGK